MDITLPTSDLTAALEHPLVSALFDRIHDGAIVVSADDRKILAMNSRARSLLGFTDADVEGCACKSMMNSPLCRTSCVLTEALAGDPATPRDTFYRGPDNDRLVHARTRILVVRAPDGKPLAGVELFSDLTEVRHLERQLGLRRSFQGIIGGSPPMTALYDLIEQVAPYDLPVLVTGESGVGKERIADAVQQLSERARGPFVKVNCAALNASLVESELFGHRRGAYTGASQDRRGKFEEADGGTILLDELGELPLSLQAKLLRVIQQGEIQRVGEDRPRTVDVRILAATNRNIEDDVDAGHFREDLYYRLAGVRLHVPPLRERLADVPALSIHFLGKFAEETERRGRPKPCDGLSDAALADLTTREWRGNVRELENVLRLAWIRVPPGGLIQPEHLQMPGRQRAEPEPLNLGEVERRTIERAMERSEGNVAAAARLLGIDRTTLWRKLKRQD
jgi:two-component system response regulator HydG